MTFKQTAGAFAAILAALITAAAMIFVGRESEDNSTLVQQAEQNALNNAKAQSFLKDLNADTSDMKTALFNVRDSFKERNARTLAADLAQLDVAFENWMRKVDGNVSEARINFGEDQSEFVSDESNSGITVDRCGIVAPFDNQTSTENCPSTFLAHSAELQVLQDARNAQSKSDDPLYEPDASVIIPMDVHTSFRIAKELVDFRLKCLKSALYESKETTNDLICPSDNSIRYAMQQRINLAGVRARELSKKLY